MKKLLSLSLLGVALFVFAVGCGSSGTPAPADRAVSEEHNPDAEHEAGAEGEHAAK